MCLLLCCLKYVFALYRTFSVVCSELFFCGQSRTCILHKNLELSQSVSECINTKLHLKLTETTSSLKMYWVFQKQLVGISIKN